MTTYRIDISRQPDIKEKPDTNEYPKYEHKSYEEAILLTGFGKFHYRVLFCCGICLIALVVEILINSYLVPAAQCDFNMTPTEKGLLTSIVFAGIILTAHMWGFLADTQGRRKMMIISLLLNIACSVIASMAPTFIVFLIIRFFNGVFICCISSVTFVYLGEFYSDETRTRAMVLVCAFFAIGTTSLPGLAWGIIPQKWSFELPWCTFNSWRIFILLGTVPAWICFFYLWLFVPESPKYLLAAQREKDALKVLQQMYAINTGNVADLYPVTALKMDTTSVHSTESFSPIAILKHMWEQTKPVFMPPYLISIIMSCIIQFGLYASSNGIILWLPEIYNRISDYQLRFPNESVTVCTAVSMTKTFSVDNLPNTTEIYNQTVPENCEVDINMEAFQNTLVIGPVSGVGFLLVGYILKYVQKKTILFVCHVISGCCGFAFYFAQNPPELLALPTFFFTMPAICISVINSVVVDAFPTNLRAMALSLSLMMGRVGTIFASMLFGALLDSNCAAVIFSLSGLVIGCGLLSLLIPTVKTVE